MESDTDTLAYGVHPSEIFCPGYSNHIHYVIHKKPGLKLNKFHLYSSFLYDRVALAKSIDLRTMANNKGRTEAVVLRRRKNINGII